MPLLAKECFYFVLQNAKASIFGGYILGVLIATYFFEVPFLHRYDAIFVAAVAYQVFALLLRFETVKEFGVIVVFHVLATVMELFKTHPSVGSWAYPEVSTAFFAIGTVPLFTGFLYSAVGSYIARAMHCLRLRYTHMPSPYHLAILAALVYINFFSHHFIVDLRYVLIVYAVVLFWRTTVAFRVYTVQWQLPLLATALLTAVVIWVAENVGTYTQVWLYPHQQLAWELVGLEKIGSWLLLLILSFALVSFVHQGRIYSAGGAQKS